MFAVTLILGLAVLAAGYYLQEEETVWFVNCEAATGNNIIEE